jgi:alpha-mannosidase
LTRKWNELSRRDFLLRSAAALGTTTATPVLASTPDQQQRKVLHIIGHSHIDSAWLWPFRDGEDAVLTTFRSALNRSNETPGFCYTH